VVWIVRACTFFHPPALVGHETSYGAMSRRSSEAAEADSLVSAGDRRFMKDGAMATSKSLPARPSLASLRKQAKKLARETAAGDAAAIARARAHVPGVVLPLTQRQAQLVIAREYGYPGWQALAAEVSRRVGRDVEWAAAHS
jgi:hypothetical protein